MRHLMIIALTALCLMAAPSAQAQQQSTGWLQHSDYQNYFDQRFYGNLVPIHVEAGLYYGHIRFSAIFGPMPPGFRNWATHHGMTDAAFAERNQQYLNQGYRLVHHQRFNTEGHLANQGIWYR